jgi:hypothetical protein
MVGQRSDGEESDFPSPREMEEWLQREIADIRRAAELRIKDATAFVTAYSKGEISQGEADERSYQYSRRWGEPIFGVFRTEGLSDEQILKQLDEANRKLHSPKPYRGRR